MDPNWTGDLFFLKKKYISNYYCDNYDTTVFSTELNSYYHLDSYCVANEGYYQYLFDNYSQNVSSIIINGMDHSLFPLIYIFPGTF